MVISYDTFFISPLKEIHWWVSKLDITNLMLNKVLIAGTKVGTEQLGRQRGCQPDGGGQLRPCAFRFRRP